MTSANEYLGSPAPSEPADAAGEAVTCEFIEYFNARDLDGLAELVDPDVTSGFFSATGSDELIEGVSGVLLEYPGILLTRGELGDEPVAVAWIPAEQRTFARMGYFCFSFSDGEDGGALVEHIEYVEDDLEGRLLAEEPDPDEIAEWEDWEEWESGQEGDE